MNTQDKIKQADAELDQAINDEAFENTDAAWEYEAAKIAKRHSLAWRWSGWGGIEFIGRVS